MNIREQAEQGTDARDLNDWCQKLTLKATTEEDGFTLAALARVLRDECVTADLITLQVALKNAAKSLQQ